MCISSNQEEVNHLSFSTNQKLRWRRELPTTYSFFMQLSGCDSTSASFNQGKIKFLKTLTKNPDLESCVTNFTDPSAHPNVIAAASENFLVALYNINPTHPITTLNKLRYKQYLTSANKVSANMASLSPTEAAAQQHAFRVFHQVQQWIGNYLDQKSGVGS